MAAWRAQFGAVLVLGIMFFVVVFLMARRWHGVWKVLHGIDVWA
jgi:hypothetical protein